jgi:glycosyltransferase involved in cell wall biosynthesis
MKQTYIFICSFNRLEPLKNLVKSLQDRNYQNIVILDNKSTYQPLLDWYQECGVNVYYCRHNYGPGALDCCRFHEQEFRDMYLHIIENEYHVYTDSDVVPVEDVPDNFIDIMVDMCKQYDIIKLGLCLKIDDLPDHFPLKSDVYNHEKIFFELGYIDDPRCKLYVAPVDTTFAVNSPGLLCGYQCTKTYRVGYFARHAPWYYDVNNLPDDESYYIKHMTQLSHWAKLIKNIVEK